MSPIDTLLQKLAARGITVTAEQAEAMAIRLAGSVEAYLGQLAENDRAAAEYEPLDGPVPDKFSEPVSYELEDPAASGLPPQSGP